MADAPAPMQGTLLSVSYRDIEAGGTFILLEDVKSVKNTLKEALEEDHWFEFVAYDGEVYFIDVSAVVVWTVESVNLVDPGLPSTRARTGMNKGRKKARRLMEGDPE